LILEEFMALDTQEFIERASGKKPLPTNVHATWRDTRRWREGIIPLSYGVCKNMLNYSCDVHMFGIPSPLGRNFTVNDLKFPVSISGSVVIVSHESRFWDDESNWQYIEKQRESPDPSGSDLAWIRHQGLPYVVAIKGHDASKLSIEEFRQLFNLEPEVRLISYPATFGEEQAHLVLSSLLSLIKMPSVPK
jgi:hypothetical protein